MSIVFKNISFLSFKEFIDKRVDEIKKEILPPMYAICNSKEICKMLQDILAVNPIYYRDVLENILYCIFQSYKKIELLTFSENKTLYKAAYEATQMLKTFIPVIYVYETDDIGMYYNAAAIGIQSKICIYFSNHIIEQQMFNTNEYKFIIGHELGHAQCNHAADKFIGLDVTPLEERMQEYSADRAGIIASKDVNAAISALVKIDLAAAMLAQKNSKLSWKNISQEEVSEYAGMLERNINNNQINPKASHPDTARRIAAIKLFAESEMYYRLTNKPFISNLLSDQQLSKYMKQYEV